jgi:hypothetical protein
MINPWNLQFKAWDNNNFMKPKLKENREFNSSQPNSWKLKKKLKKDPKKLYLSKQKNHTYV